MIPKKDWDRYIDTGKLELKYVKDLVDRIKKGERLNLQDLQVYQTHADIIEVLLKRPKKD